MKSNQDQPTSAPDTSQTRDQPSSNPVLRNRPLMIVTAIVGAGAVIGLVWACLTFFRFV
ncbi:MAG: hypothetical protein IT331_18345 [Anaerolineae bacterium]|nr:hypothetical protein [Anaerolineae bacterium]